MSDAARWALPQLLRAFRQGHRSHRGRVLRLIEGMGDETLSFGKTESRPELCSRLIARDSLDRQRFQDGVDPPGVQEVDPDSIAPPMSSTEPRRKVAADQVLEP